MSVILTTPVFADRSDDLNLATQQMIEAFEGTGDHIGEVNQMLI
jgi:hypothetical protein